MSIQKCHVSTNLIDCSVEEGGYSSSTGNKSPSDTVYRVSDHIAVEPNTSYVFGVNGSSYALQLFEYTKNKNFIGSSVVSQNNYFTTGENTYFITLSRNKSSGADYWQLNLGQNILPYEPYGNTWNSIPYRKYGTETDTLTSFPAEIIGDGTNATAVIKGNLSQSGTPTAASPIYPSECGDVSANLTDVNNFTNSEVTDTGRDYFRAQLRLPDSTNTSVSIRKNGHYKLSIENVGNTTVTFRHSGQTTNILIFSYTATFPTPQTVTVSFDVEGYDPENLNGLVLRNIMLNVGSDELPYEPYGYKIPILTNSTTTPVYLGEVQTTRKIGKLVLTGQENWALNNSGTANAYLSLSTGAAVMGSTEQLSTHYQYNTITSSNTNKGLYMTQNGVLRVREEEPTQSDKTTFKSFLQTQYANGTPVIVWCVLATEETAVVNEPLMKIGDYADSISASIPTTGTPEQFDVDTTLKPSEVQLTYHGWHNHNDTEFSE